MKVLIIDSLIANDYSLCLCNSLKEIGVNISLVVTEDRQIVWPINYKILPWAPPKNPGINKFKKITQYYRYLWRLVKYMIKGKADIFHFQFLRRERFESIFLLFLRLLGKNLVHTAHNVLPHENSKIDYLFKYILYKSSRFIIVHSDYIKRKLIKKFRIEKEKIKIVPHGNFDIYKPQNTISQKKARKRFNLSEKDDVLLFFGYIREYKGLDLLIDAFKIASETNQKLKLIIAGSPHTPKLERFYHHKIENIVDTGKIIYHPKFIQINDVPAYFIGSDIVVLPYKKIDHSGIVHLAYSFEKPIIATRVGDFEETIEHGVSGYLIEKNDPEHLAAMIAKSFSQPERLEMMIKSIRNLNSTEYSWENVALKTKYVYESLMRKNL